MNLFEIFMIATLVGIVGILYVCTVLQQVNYRVVIRTIKMYIGTMIRRMGI